MKLFKKLFMATAWVILEISIVFFYKNLHEFKTQQQNDAVTESERMPISINSSNTNYNSISSNSTNLPGDNQESEAIINNTQDDFNQIEAIHGETNDDREKLVNTSSHKNNSSNSYGEIRVIDNSETGPLVVRLYNEYIRDDMIAILTVSFTVFFMQTCLEVKFYLYNSITLIG
jgi:hypothetical protein